MDEDPEGEEVYTSLGCETCLEITVWATKVKAAIIASTGNDEPDDRWLVQSKIARHPDVPLSDPKAGNLDYWLAWAKKNGGFPAFSCDPDEPNLFWDN